MHTPPGYERREVNGALLVLRSDLAEALVTAGVDDPEALVRRAPSELRGRGGLARLELGDASVIVRPLRRGGLLGLFVRRCSFDPRRARAELEVSAAAAARGAAVLEVVAAVTRPAALGYRHGLATLEVAGAQDLMTLLRGGPSPRQRARALRAAGRAIRALHEAGVDHVDLNLKNVLLRPDGQALVIDLDLCRLTDGPLPQPAREANLLRLLRSWVKLSVAEPAAVRPRDPLQLARAYAGRDREALRRWVRLGAAARFPLHRLRWRLLPPRV